MRRPSPQPPSGTSHLVLPTLKLAYEKADGAYANGSMAGFFGDAGTGKTYAVESWVERRNHLHGWVTASPRPSAKEIFEEIIYAITDIVPTGTKVQMRRECEDLLRSEGPVVIIDEAQNLGALWLSQLRDLHDRCQKSFAMFLVGGHGCAQRLKSDPMLWGRMTYKAWFKNLTGSALIAALNAYHPLLAETDDRVLVSIDRKAGFHGNLREWSNFILVAAPLAERAGTTKLTAKVVRASFALMGIDE